MGLSPILSGIHTVTYNGNAQTIKIFGRRSSKFYFVFHDHFTGLLPNMALKEVSFTC